MAKLPRAKKNEGFEEEVTVVTETHDEEVEVDEVTGGEDQGNAVNGIIDHAASVSSTAEVDETDAEEAENETEKEEVEEKEVPSADNDNFGVTISAPKPTVATKATTVKVATVCDHSCYIGGKPYHFKKGVPTTVPEPVKQILKNAGLLAAL